MPVLPNDLSLTPQQLLARYTRAELEETKRLLTTYGESRYRSNFSTLAPKDPGKMDMFSSEYGAELASNIVPSAVNLFTGLADMIFNPIDTMEAIYDAGLDGAVEALKEQYGSWENIKRTIATDPVGQATVVAPGFGLAGRLQSAQKLRAMAQQGVGGMLAKLPPTQRIGKANIPVGEVIRPAVGMAAETTRRVSQPIIDIVTDPVTAIGSVALRGTATLMSGTGKLGRIGLEFLTGEPVQSLEAMQRTGRLTDAQMDIVGLNPMHWLGRFDDAATQKKFGETPREHFLRARSDDPDIAGGFRDEAATIGHIAHINHKYANIILQQTDALMEKIFQNWMDGETFATVRREGGFVDKSVPTVKGIAPTITIPSLLGGKLDEISWRRGFVSSLNKKLKDAGVGIRFNPPNPETGKVDYIPVDTGIYIPNTKAKDLVNWMQRLVNSNLSDLPTMKTALIGDAFSDTPGVIQMLLAHRKNPGNAPTINAFYDTLREQLDELAQIADTQSTYPISDLLPESGALQDLMDNPMSQDNAWAHIIRHESVRTDIERAYSAFKEHGTGDSEVLNAYMKAIQNNPIKKQLIDEIENVTGESIHAGIAGLISRRWTPSSLVARGSAVSALQRTAAVGLGGLFYNPALFLFVPFSSPKFTGKFLHNIGLVQRSVDYGKALTRHMLNHPVGKRLGDHKRTIWSIGTVLEQIQSYNALHAPQESVGYQQEENR
tara:strand:- start:46 stop:2202 length:2157 start_codon:yes stop_codon:yes gene_type:complete